MAGDLLTKLGRRTTARLTDAREFSEDAAADHRKAMAEFQRAAANRKKDPAAFAAADERLKQTRSRLETGNEYLRQTTGESRQLRKGLTAAAGEKMAKTSAHTLRAGDTVHLEGKPHAVKFVSAPNAYGTVQVTTAHPDTGHETTHHVDKFAKFEKAGGEAKGGGKAAKLKALASEGKKAPMPKVLIQGKKGGAYYLTTNGRKVYVGKN